MRRLVRADDPAIEAIGRIYEASIPASERKPTEWLTEAVGRFEFAVLIAEAFGVAIGFATLFAPRGSAALLEYLAVDCDHRNAGVGALLFQAVVAIVGEQPLLIEVDMPNDPVSKRRVDFYRRLGCEMILGVNYILPLQTVPLVMRLMKFPAEATITSDSLRRSLGDIYLHVYAQAINDPRIDRMVAEFHQ